VARTYNTKPETERKQVRSRKHTRSRFNILQGIAQKRISADKIYRATPRSGETEKDVRRNVIHMHRTKISATNPTNGTCTLAPAVKSLDAIFLLRTTQKFSGCVGGSSSITSRPNITSQQVSAVSGSSSRTIGSAKVPFAGHITVEGGDSRGESHDNNPSPCNLSTQAPYAS
jgi:hypothetical protein